MGGMGAEAPTASTTALYLSEVPVDWTEESIMNLHSELGLNPQSLSGIKMLEKKLEHPTGAAILRYTDPQSAADAMQLLEGRPVMIPGGHRAPVVRPADPIKRTHNRGGGF